MRPLGPVARTSDKLTPRSRANLRVAGAASTFPVGAADACAACDSTDERAGGTTTSMAGLPLALTLVASLTEPAAPATSMVTITAPTAQLLPSSAKICAMVPALGDGISTVALSVMTSTIG